MKNNLLVLLILTLQEIILCTNCGWKWKKSNWWFNTRIILCVMILVITPHLWLFTFNELSCKMDILNIKLYNYVKPDIVKALVSSNSSSSWNQEWFQKEKKYAKILISTMPIQNVVTEILNYQILCVKDCHSKSRIRKWVGKSLTTKSSVSICVNMAWEWTHRNHDIFTTTWSPIGSQ